MNLSLVLAAVAAGKGISLNAVPRLFPDAEGNPRINVGTVYRWRSRGLETPKGRIRLAAVKCGKSFFTTVEAVHEFILAASATAEADTREPRSPVARHREAAQAARKLDAAGI